MANWARMRSASPMRMWATPACTKPAMKGSTPVGHEELQRLSDQGDQPGGVETSSREVRHGRLRELRGEVDQGDGRQDARGTAGADLPEQGSSSAASGT
eukprot:1541158-Heterocapsa_arctica.AAC.1